MRFVFSPITMHRIHKDEVRPPTNSLSFFTSPLNLGSGRRKLRAREAALSMDFGQLGPLVFSPGCVGLRFLSEAHNYKKRLAWLEFEPRLTFASPVIYHWAFSCPQSSVVYCMVCAIWHLFSPGCISGCGGELAGFTHCKELPTGGNGYR